MPSFLAGMPGEKALMLAAFALAAAALFGGGYVWGDTHATRIAMDASSRAAQAQVASVSAAYQTTITGYTARLKAQAARGDQLAAALAQSRTQLAASAAAAKETISHAVSTNSVCDLPAAAVAMLRAQPARH